MTLSSGWASHGQVRMSRPSAPASLNRYSYVLHAEHLVRRVPGARLKETQILCTHCAPVPMSPDWSCHCTLCCKGAAMLLYEPTALAMWVPLWVVGLSLTNQRAALGSFSTGTQQEQHKWPGAGVLLTLQKKPACSEGARERGPTHQRGTHMGIEGVSR